MSVTQNLRSLADRWREQACRLRMLEAHGQAASLELAATELDAEIERLEQELLSISEASAVCGYSEEHLRRLVHEGSLPAEQRDQQERDWWRERVEKPLELKPLK